MVTQTIFLSYQKYFLVPVIFIAVQCPHRFVLSRFHSIEVGSRTNTSKYFERKPVYPGADFALLVGTSKTHGDLRQFFSD